MATATMGPPLDPLDPPRRSHRAGRRQTTSGTGSSGSTSKSPELTVPPENQMRQRENMHRPSMPSKVSSNRSRRTKTDEIEDAVQTEEHTKPPVLNGSAVQNGRAPKRKTKSSPPLETAITVEPGPIEDDQNAQADKDDSGDTRCICGRDGE